MLDGFVEVALQGQQAAEAVMDLCRGRLELQRAAISVLGRLGVAFANQEVPKVVPWKRRSWIDLYGVHYLCAGLLKSALVQQQLAQIVLGFEMVRFETQGFHITPPRLLE